jgi:DNA-binding response OmpR family regulator
MNNRLKVLLLEDDTNLGLVIQEHLQLQGYAVTLCADGVGGSEVFSKDKFDLCLVDVMMPNKDGFTFVAEIRAVNQQIPLIFLTAKALKEDKIKGFKVGCDDYITKPFSIEELTLRIEAVLRRSHGQTKSPSLGLYEIGKYNFDSNRQTLTFGKEQRKLTPRESELLRLLCGKSNQTVTREEALTTIWNDDSYFAGRSMDVFVSKLRKYLKDDPSIEILSVHGKGFRLVVE